MHKIFKLPELGLEVEIGKYARQADGAAWIKAGNNIVLSTAVASKTAREFLGFFPLTVEYRERTSAAGKFPGGYIKREGRLSDLEILTSRLIDRPIRPLFPSNFFNEVQVLSTVYSADGQFPTSILGILGASLALTISPIPFLEPVGAVQACKRDGKWVINSNHEDIAASDASVIIAGTKNGISMVEGHCNNVLEEDLIDLLFLAHEVIKKQIAWQESIQKELGITKLEIQEIIDWDDWKDRIRTFLPEDFSEALFAQNKIDRGEKMERLKSSVFTHFSDELKAGNITISLLNYLFDSLMKESVPDLIAKKKSRIDGRKLDQVRDIFIEVGNLPEVHGSALFQRGETQALASLTLGTGQDAQKMESLFGESSARTFMLHYNFPPFCTGEAKPMRGTSRREIGHGYLAETSFKNVIPSQEEFPYVIRSVSDVLESNGSSSMATVCGTTLALMDAGVPLKEMVSGIAMGLIRDTSGNFHVLTDILGIEDAYGLMDFKVTGTEKGIMAFQLDVKDPTGLTRELFVKALAQARDARLHILGKMKAILDMPRTNLHAAAPRVTSFKVDTDKIGGIIGPGGKIIREIIAQTSAQIDIEDDGTVKIYSNDAESAKIASDWVKTLAGEIKPGSTYNGTVKKVADFGLFVELVPGKEGLVHISTIDRSYQEKIYDYADVGTRLEVKVVAYDKETDRIRLVAPKLEKPVK